MNMNTLPFPTFRRLAALAVLGLLLTVAVSRAQVPITIYARFANGTGVWAGEATDPGRLGWVKLRTVSFGTAVAASGAAPTFDSVVLNKAVDRITPQIFASLTSGAPINGGSGASDVTIDFTRPGIVVSEDVTFFRIELRLVSFADQKTSAGEGDELLLETVTLKNVAFRYTLWTILPNGTQGTSVVRSWSTATNTATFTP